MPLTAPTITSPSTMITNRPIRSTSDGVAAIAHLRLGRRGALQRFMATTNPAIWTTSATAHSRYRGGPSAAPRRPGRGCPLSEQIEYGIEAGR